MAKQETGKTKERSHSKDRGPVKDRNRNELIHCENCGEYYAATYRSCPFCEERPTRGRGGSHTVTNKRGGGYGAPLSPVQIAGYVLSAVVIVAAVAIVFFMLRGLVGQGDPGHSDPPETSTVAPTTQPETTPPEETEAPVVSNATGITLDKTDFTIRTQDPSQIQISATVTPEDYTGTIVWTSSNPDQVYVDQTGKVYAVSPGTVEITATIGNVSATCIVRNQKTDTLPAGVDAGTPSAPETSTQPESGTQTESGGQASGVTSVVLSKTATGGDGTTYTWTSSDTSVATVSETGLVTRVGSGTCTVTVTSGGQSASCIVRVQ